MSCVKDVTGIVIGKPAISMEGPQVLRQLKLTIIIRCKMRKKSLKLNLGCGKRILPGYVNIDSRPFKDEVTAMDVRNLMFEDESVDEILAEFVLEHIPYFEVPETIWEWWRVLKKGGVLTLLVPDFEQIAKAYLQNELDRNTLHFHLYNSVINPERQSPHLCAFDKIYLQTLLRQEGFKIEFMDNLRTKVELKVVAKKIDKEKVCH
jgi:SAM-dependent methyltransferase